MKIADSLWQRRPLGADARLRRWLLDRGSLTQRIQQRSRRFAVELRRSSRGRANRDERGLVGATGRPQCAVREVVLYGDGCAVVFAHSIADARALDGAWRLLRGLGSRPLGAALFADPRVVRRPLRFRRVRAGHELHAGAGRALGTPPPQLWARRSLFEFRGARLLVTEVFLPAILALAP